jgi:hypothetical protein
LDTDILISGVRTDSPLSDTLIALSHQQLRRMDFALPQRYRWFQHEKYATPFSQEFAEHDEQKA